MVVNDREDVDKSMNSIIYEAALALSSSSTNYSNLSHYIDEMSLI